MPVNCTDRHHPVRVSVDLPPDAYSSLRQFAFDAGMTHAAVMRALVDFLDDADIGDRVRESAP
jgi:hypothetical protein